MFTTVRAVLSEKNMDVGNTVYNYENNNFFDYPITVGKFFKVIEDKDKANNFYVLKHYYEYIDRKMSEQEYSSVVAEIKEISHRIKEIKIQDANSFENLAIILQAREKKKELIKELERLEESYKNKANQKFFRGKNCTRFLEYKSSLICTSFDNITRILPEVEQVDLPRFKTFPLFVDGLEQIKQAMEQEESMGIVGGPCLFGMDELLVKVIHNNGKEYVYNFCNGKNYTKNKYSEEEDLAEHIFINKNHINNIEFINNKKGITTQEYDSLKYLFEFSSVLNAKIAIPIPDLSYIKFCSNIMEPLDESIKKAAINNFRVQAHRITDIYLETINYLKKQYANIMVKVLHDRDTELCELFYQRRASFLENDICIRKITGNIEKKDVIIDYIMMLALPYYLFDVKHVIQIDSSDETDAHRKCKQIHKDDFGLHGILYPEYLSRDGINTVYNARLEDKDYLTKEELGYEK